MDSTSIAFDAQSTQIVNQVLTYWRAQNTGIAEFFARYEEAVYKRQVAPGRNTGIYLLAHLIASNDSMFPMFGLGDRIFPELTPLQKDSESSIDMELNLNDLKRKWKELNEALELKFSEISLIQWLEKHNSVSDEDFKIDPMRNKLNVLLGRASHQSYHRGQLVFLTEEPLI
jgi:hypothetical protein